MLPLQTIDISEYLYEEFCEKYTFYFYERALGGSNFDKNYSEMWADFLEIKNMAPRSIVKFSYITKLNTKVTFRHGDLNYDYTWEFDLKQQKNGKTNNI